MRNYLNIFKNLLIIILLVVVLKLINTNRHLTKQRVDDLKVQRQASEQIVKAKEREIADLRSKINDEEFLIDEAVEILNELRQSKREVETLYVEKVQKINTFDANELKAYFDEELN